MPTLQELITQALRAKNVGAVKADPGQKAADEYTYATEPFDVMKRTRDYGPLNPVIDFVTPSRADVFSAGLAKAAVLGGKALAGAKAALPVAKAAVLYHGSPFSFERFLKGKIGKGTGHQSEGYGHYFTDLEDEAKSYVEDLVDYSRGWPPKRTPGNLYKVEVPDDLVGKMLNYDEPLGNQPAVLDKLRGLGSTVTQDMTGRQFYEQLRKQLLEQALRTRQLTPEKLDELQTLIRRNMEYDEEQFPKALLKRSFKDATSQLEQVGIPGNKYLGYNPRGGASPQNVVVFPSNERAIKILERTPVIRPR